MKINIERNVMVPMRDGVTLATDIYHPDTEKPCPALIHRLPYGKHNTNIVSTLLLDPIAAVERGYAVVVQDTRGTGASDGRQRPIFQERADGHDTISWAATQSWCDGTTGIYGSSYMGVTTLQASVNAPEALKASLAYITAGSYDDTWCYVGGVFELGFQLRWSLAAVRRQIQRMRETGDADLPSGPVAHLARFAESQQDVFESGFNPSALIEACGTLAPWYTEFLDNPPPSDFWRPVDVTAAADQISVPIMTIAGWNDGFLKSGLDLYAALRVNGPKPLRDKHRLLIGPWDHQAYFGMETLSRAGSRDYGAAAVGGQPGLQTTALDWFDHWLRATPASHEAPVRYFDIGPNAWEESSVWPPSGGKTETWYLHSTGEADRADGRLSLQRPAFDEPDDSFQHDPDNPVPTHGGRHLIHYLPAGVQDQRAILERADVVVYRSGKLTKPSVLAGSAHVTVHFSATTECTDLYAVLLDIAPDGTVQNVADGIRRLVSSDIARECTIDLWDTAYHFEVGHQIGLSIAGSCFPRFVRNTGHPDPAKQPDSGPTFVRIKHTPDEASALTLRVLPCDT